MNNHPSDSFSEDVKIEKAIGELTGEVIASYKESKKSHELGKHLPALHHHLLAGWVRDSVALTDAYFSCAIRLLNSVLRDKSTTNQFVQELFASYGRYQRPFLQTLYLGLLRPWIVPSEEGTLTNISHLQRYLNDLRQRSTDSSESKWFNDLDTRIGDQAGLRYAWQCCLHALQILPRLGGWRGRAQVAQDLIMEDSITFPGLPDALPIL